MREVGLALLGERPSWVMPGPDGPGRVALYEEIPCEGETLGRLEQRTPGSLTSPPSVSLVPEYDDSSNVLERRIIGIRLRQRQLGRQFGGECETDEAVRAREAKVGRLGGLDGAAERHRASARL